MPKIRLLCISKKEKEEIRSLSQHYICLCRGLGSELEVLNLFSKKINQLQKKEYESLNAYSELFAPYLNCENSIAFAPNGKKLDSLAFCELLRDQSLVHFFIGGAYGLSEACLKQCRSVISLSPLTFSHEIAKIVAIEQIYRALSLIHNHPYHK